MKFIVVLSALLAMASAQGQSCGDPTPKLPGGRFKDLTDFPNCDALARSPKAGTYCTTYHDGVDGCPCQCGNVRGNNNRPLSSAPPPGATTVGPQGTTGPAGPLGAAGCFHSSATVLTESGRATMTDLLNMKNVKVQALNDNNELEFSPVEWWIHADPHQELDYYTLVTESGHKLQLSDRHMIYVTPCEQPGQRTPKFAENVKIGECVFVQNAEGQLVASPVVSADQMRMTGAYSPITATGSIVVDGVAASVYSTVENESLQKLLFSYLIAAKNLIPNSFTGLQLNSEIVHIPEIMKYYLEMSKYFFA